MTSDRVLDIPCYVVKSILIAHLFFFRVIPLLLTKYQIVFLIGLGISETNNPKVYCTALIKGDHVSSLLDKSSMGTSHAFIGLAGIYNHKLFFKDYVSPASLLKERYRLLLVSRRWYKMVN